MGGDVLYYSDQARHLNYRITEIIIARRRHGVMVGMCTRVILLSNNMYS